MKFVITNIDVIGAEIVDAAYGIHKGLGPGLLEKPYERLLAKELRRRRLSVECQRPVPLEYDGLKFEGALVPDLVVNGLVVVEVKALEKVLPVHLRQVYTYIRALNLTLGYLLNFGDVLMKHGIYRIVNGYHPTPESTLRIHRDNKHK